MYEYKWIGKKNLIVILIFPYKDLKEKKKNQIAHKKFKLIQELPNLNKA